MSSIDLLKQYNLMEKAKKQRLAKKLAIFIILSLVLNLIYLNLQIKGNNVFACSKKDEVAICHACLLYTSPSPRDS